MGKSSKARASGKAKARARGRAKAKARGTMVNVGEMSESSRSLQEHDANVTLSFQLLNVDDSERVSSKFSRWELLSESEILFSRWKPSQIFDSYAIVIHPSLGYLLWILESEKVKKDISRFEDLVCFLTSNPEKIVFFVV